MYHVVLVLVSILAVFDQEIKFQRSCSRNKIWTGLQMFVPQRRKGPHHKSNNTNNTTTIATKKPGPSTSIIAIIM